MLGKQLYVHNATYHKEENILSMVGLRISNQTDLSLGKDMLTCCGRDAVAVAESRGELYYMMA